MRHHIAAEASPSTPATPYLDSTKRGKKRGSYNCGRCGVPKKGHVCDTATTSSPATPRPLPPRPQRALTFDDADVPDSAELEAAAALVQVAQMVDAGGGWPAGCLMEVMKKLPPLGLIAAAGVCVGWREVAGRVWKATEELRVRVPNTGSVGFVGSLLKKCPSLLRISLRIESDVDATMLACIAFSCPNLESLEILISESSVNRITGDELGRFVGDRRCLSSLKMEGCSSMGSIIISSASLSTLWLSDLHSLSKTIINCPNLREVSLNFVRQEDDGTDITTLVDNLGRYCPRLQNLHIASTKISHSTVLALSGANLKGLRMLSLVLGSGITDASVAAIAYSFTKLELLDLSGSSISDSGLGIICNVLSRTLTRLLLALCPNVTSSGIQFATAQLPNLELMDCGMSISDPNDASVNESNEQQLQKSSKSHHIYQKLIVKHSRLKKLSLWGCSGLDALYLNCPELKDLNLISCRNLHPGRIVLECPSLERIHAANCVKTLHEVVDTQVNNNNQTESQILSKRMADGSKRVRIPHMLFQLPSDDTKQSEVRKRRCIVSTG
ncbi:F-box/LRR-repeat protein 17 [Silene latifolia]|uniref:F-box/LRR-repeat protein 17 n=1 Tax=Silene latifolia TaxID=37657 RepID=UPI003D76F314